ncbi:MAG: caspase family protein [Roseibium sp.]|uniref:caspase family protein n=1 Tax=Roseibium sp. TaxID=1936156 RepID=UPI003D9C65B1
MDSPVLQLNTGGHTAQINRLVFSPDGEHLVSVSDDKTARVWETQTGKSVRTYRGQIGEHRSGQLYASAMTDDGKTIALAGWIGDGTRKPCCGDIRLIDFETGNIIGVLKQHRNIVLDLEFSEDGRFLLSADQNGVAIVWDLETQKGIAKFEHSYGLYQAIFINDYRQVVTSGSNSVVHVWDIATGEIIHRLDKHDAHVFALVRLDNETFASGDLNGDLRFWDSQTGKQRFENLRVNGQITDLSTTANGDHLAVSSVGKWAGPKVNLISTHTRSIVHTYEDFDNTIRGIAINPRGDRLAISGGSGNEIHIWEISSGRPARTSNQNPLVIRGVGRPINSVGFAPDGTYIGWGSQYEFNGENNRGPLEFKLRLPDAQNYMGSPVKLSNGEQNGFDRALQDFGEIRLSRQKGFSDRHYSKLLISDSKKILGENVRDVNNGYSHVSFSFSANGDEIISGGDLGVLEKLNLKGDGLGRFLGHTGVVRAITVSDDDRFVLSGSHDQTVKLWNRQTRELIVTIFHSSDGEWAVWTPQGYYISSPKGDEYVGWHINRGPSLSADYTTASQLKDRLRNLAVVEKAILYASAEKAIKELRPRDIGFAKLLQRGPPQNLGYDPIKAHDISRDGILSLNLRFLDDRFPIRKVEAYINRINYTPDRPEGFLDPNYVVDFEQTLFLPLALGKNDIRITVHTNWGSKSISIEVMSDFDGLKKDEGTLHLLALGSQSYRFLDNYDLEFPATDAETVAEYLQQKMGKGFKDVKTEVITMNNDLGASAENIKAALSRIADSRIEDTIVLFLSGHGERDGDRYLFLPEDARRFGNGWVEESVIDWSLIQNALQMAKGERIVFMDTCYSGNTYHPRIMNDASDADIFLLTASDQNTWAEEDKSLGHGLFTYALKQGMDGQADRDNDGVIRLFELASFVSKEVMSLSGGEQIPTITSQISKDSIIVRP